MTAEVYEIKIIGEFIDRMTGGLKRASKSAKQMQKIYKGTHKLLNGGAQALLNNASNVNKLTAQYDSFGKVMTAPMETWKKLNEQGANFNSRGAKFANTTRKMMHGMRGFKMEMLGVMFFGMALANTMKQLLKPAAESAGIFEIFGTVLEVLFLPIMIALLPLILKVAEYFMNLDNSTKMVLGVIALLALAFGSLLMFVGQLFLGLGSLILFLPVVQGIFAGLAGAITGTLGLILAVVAAFVIGFMMAWKDNFGKIREWTKVFADSLKNIFGGLVDIIKGVFKLIWSILSGDTKGAVEGLKKIWEGFKSYFIGLGQFIVSVLVIAALSITKLLVNIVKFVWNTIISAIQGAINLVIWGINKVIQLMNKIPGVNLGEIGKVDFSGAKLGELKEFEGSKSQAITEYKQDITINIEGGDPEKTRQVVQEELQVIAVSSNQ